MLIIVVIIDQYKYDNFVTKRDRIYRIESINNANKSSINITKYASTTYPLYDELLNNYAIIEDAVVIYDNFNRDAIYKENKFPIRGFYASESFFNLFDFELTPGSFSNPLKEPFSIILKEETAKKYFEDKDPIGKFIQIDTLGSFKVTGLIPESKNKSQFQFQALVSASTIPVLESSEKIHLVTNKWESFSSSYIYILVDKNANIENINSALGKISLEKYKDLEEADVSFYLKPFNKIVPGDFIANEIGVFLPKIFIIFLGGLSLIIILSAAFNYTSLSMARALLRSKEVGVRKTLGATRRQIILQFLSEAFLVALFALIFAIVILQLILPGFSGMKMMSMLEIRPEQDFTIYLAFFIFALLVGFLSGILPSVYISSFNPIKVLKGATNVKLLSKITLRKILLVTQFTFSMIFIISIIAIYSQMNYMLNAKMGFERDVVYNIWLQKNNFEVVKDYYSQFPEVTEISAASHVPGVGNFRSAIVRQKAEDEKIEVDYFAVDQNYIDVMGLELIKGSNFPEKVNTENESFVIADERMLKRLNLGTPTEAIGKSIIIEDSTLVEIIGVIKDYHYAALFLPQKSLMLRYKPDEFRLAVFRIDAGSKPEIVDKFKNGWDNIDKYKKYRGDFLDTEIKEYYSYFEDVLYTVGFASVLAIVIACLGLLGMATYSTQTRIKEIGVRKVFGAEPKSIVYLISKTYIKLFIVAAIIAGPLAYIINNMWIQYIADHATFGFGVIFLGIFLIISFGMITIASQTLKAANINPAESLRYE
jgi:putative ABC transport system permease protein